MRGDNCQGNFFATAPFSERIPLDPKLLKNQRSHRSLVLTRRSTDEKHAANDHGFDSKAEEQIITKGT